MIARKPQIATLPTDMFPEGTLMKPTTAMIGIHPEELQWIRLLVSLLRHADPGTPELTRQALLYLDQSAGQPSAPRSQPRPEARSLW